MRKTALITGANKGIGLELARQLLAKGIAVTLTARSKKRGEVALSQLKKDFEHVFFIPMDVSQPQTIKAAGLEFGKNNASLDILVNNAAIYIDNEDSILKSDPKVLTQTWETNVMGPIIVAQTFAPYLIKSPAGRILNVSSGYGSLSRMGMHVPGYSLSKVAINGVTRQLAAALQEKGVAVNSVCPGWVRTDMGGKDADRSVEEGAAGLTWLATEAPQNLTGLFFRDRKPIPW